VNDFNCIVRQSAVTHNSKKEKPFKCIECALAISLEQDGQSPLDQIITNERTTADLLYEMCDVKSRMLCINNSLVLSTKNPIRIFHFGLSQKASSQKLTHFVHQDNFHRLTLLL